MSDVTNTVFLTGAVVVVGRWAADEPLNVKIVTGGLFLALTLSAIGNANESFAALVADVLLVTAILSYGLPIATLIGATTGAKEPTTKPQVTKI
jgi:hypothetical protein